MAETRREINPTASCSGWIGGNVVIECLGYAVLQN